jgi:uncharacterized protein YmfQ (DUF2313 family)
MAGNFSNAFFYLQVLEAGHKVHRLVNSNQTIHSVGEAVLTLESPVCWPWHVGIHQWLQYTHDHCYCC